MIRRTNVTWQREDGLMGTHSVRVEWDEAGGPHVGRHVYTSMSKNRPWADVEIARLVGAIRANGRPSNAAAHGEPEPTGDSPAHHIALAVATVAFTIAERRQARRLARILGRTA